jgi:hypothetical protein
MKAQLSGSIALNRSWWVLVSLRIRWPRGKIPLGHLRKLLEQLAELNLRGKLGLASLPEPEFTTCQRILRGIHLEPPGTRSEDALRDQTDLSP